MKQANSINFIITILLFFLFMGCSDDDKTPKGTEGNNNNIGNNIGNNVGNNNLNNLSNNNCTPSVELCNGQDDDCDGDIDELWTKLNTACSNGLLGECVAEGVWQCNTDGSGVVCSAVEKTGVAELCDNKDNDCDGVKDNGTLCGDGEKCENGQCVSSCVPTAETCDGVDNDCDTVVDNGTLCGDEEKCENGQCVSSCIPTDEVCDGLDNDCDGDIDENVEGTGQLTVVCTSACGDGVKKCENGELSDCTAPMGITETCNGEDDDCDGETDEDFDVDRDGFTTCDPEKPDCNDADSKVNPDAGELCDNLDNDCDGDIDEDFDQDGDGYAVPPCGNDCDDTNENIHPLVDEVCDNTIDEDCDGQDLECENRCIDNDQDGYGDGPDCTGTDCDDNDAGINPGVEEICDDGIDQNCVDGDLVCPFTCNCNPDEVCDQTLQECRQPLIEEYWAPQFYVETDTDCYGCDYFGRVNYDGDFNASNNAENLHGRTLSGYVYQSKVVTATHYYLGYYLFFPLVWTPDGLGSFVYSYENVMKGILLVVRRDGTDFGTLELMETTTLNNVLQYNEQNVALSGRDTLEGTVRFDTTGHHPIVYVSSRSHNLYGNENNAANVGLWDENGFPDGRGIIYNYYNLAGVPENISDEDVSYTFEDLSDLFAYKNSLGEDKLFREFCIFSSDLQPNNRSLAPWCFMDVLNADQPVGWLLWNPADMVAWQFQAGWGGDISKRYEINPYATEVELSNLKVLEDTDPWGNAPDPYIKLVTRDGGGNEIVVLNHSSYGEGAQIQANWNVDGIDDGESVNLTNDMSRNYFYGFIHPDFDGTDDDFGWFGVEIMDEDDFWTGDDDWLMSSEQRYYFSFDGSQSLDFSYSILDVTVKPSIE